MNPYLRKYGLREQLIEENPQDDLGIVVVIPACKEPAIHYALNALYSCERPGCAVEIIVIVNAGENASEELKAPNRKTYADCLSWQNQKGDPGFAIYAFLENNLPRKHAGVGLARKIGMDEAVRRFDLCENKRGIIACFDADSTCAPNYLVQLEKHFRENPKTPGCSIQFRHATFGTDFEPHTYLGITYYELHLRYYNQALRAINFPNAYHTIGSSMAVTTRAYQKQGGMNKRKAGEDFYFLHKIMQLGNFSELNTTEVYPSPRPSDRVPFGTGKAINTYLKDPQKGFYTYNFKAFKYLDVFFKNIPEFYLTRPTLIELGGTLPYILIDFLSVYFFDERMEEIRENSAGFNSFKKRFYQWFNAFMILKFVHFVRDNAHPNVRVEKAALEFLREMNYPETDKIHSTAQLLEVYRQLDRKALPASVLAQ